jgi:SAM-dependent methyltransferase
MSSDQRYGRYLRDRHRPAHGRRTAASHAAFLLPHLRPGDRVLDLGCGPGSITTGLDEAVAGGPGRGGRAVGVDLQPGPAPVPLARADVRHLPFPDGVADAVFLCAVLQHAGDPLALLCESRRVCRPGAVIGVADADRGGALVWPPDPWLDRGQEILDGLRDGTSIHVGRRLRDLLHRAGFVDAVATARGGGGGGPSTATQAGWEAAQFESAPVVDAAVERGLATPEEMAEVAAAWRRWGDHPGATMARHWFEATARAPAAPAPPRVPG